MLLLHVAVLFDMYVLYRGGFKVDSVSIEIRIRFVYLFGRENGSVEKHAHLTCIIYHD